MRIGCLQFAPQVGDVDNNLNRADSVLSKANPDDLDLLVLPELAFSGYNFKSLQEITPFLERSDSGITSLWARTIALRYNCTVTVGYPEKVDVAMKWPTGPEYYNSAIVVNGDGETIANYRKSFLYHTDETWALEGDRGFFEGFIPGLGNTSIGICMDLNPYKFEAPWSDFEFAFHIEEMQSNLVILTMAWMTREDPRHFSRMPNDPDMETLTYWVTRLEPLIRSDTKDEIIVVFCNRTGHEGDATYTGTSAVIGICEGEVKVYGLLGRGEKELLVVDTHNPPYARLVYRPETAGKATTTPISLQKPDEHFESLPDSLGLGDGFSSQLKPESTLPAVRNDSTGMSTRKHHPPAITIPCAPDLVTTNSAPSPGTGSINVPTPSAPSPTPMALRPRLIIPESPSIIPHQYPPGHMMSPDSLVSAHSVRSNMSAFSIETVRSNPRRPEDSTPYPNSAAPLSGYPRDFKSERRIYGGNVAISSGDEPLSPASTFKESSPTTSGFFWDPTHSTVQSPFSAWPQATPIGRHPEPFPWHAITAEDLPNVGASNKLMNEERMDHNKTPRDRSQIHSQPIQYNSEHTESKIGLTSESSDVAQQIAPETVANYNAYERPSSPKSRNASRSRLRQKSDSALGQRQIAAATALLEEITQRAQSVQTIRAESATNSPCPERLASPKSSNASKTRVVDTIAVSDDQLIHIAASPSILRNDVRHPYRSLSRVNHIQRSNSSPRVKSQSLGGMDGISTPPMGIQRPASRAASRGRTPGPIDPATDEGSGSASAPQERSSSLDSDRNDLLHHRRVNSQPQNWQSRTRKTSSNGQNHRQRQHSRRKSRGIETSEFAVFEHVICPGCPMHGRSRSNAPPNTANPIATNSPDPRASESLSRPTSAFESRQRPESSMRKESAQTSARNGLAIVNMAKDEGIKDDDKSPPMEGTEASDSASVTDTLQTISTPGRSPSTPSPYEPITPKAMTLKPDSLEIDPISSRDLGAISDTGTMAYIKNSIDTPTEANLSV